MWFNIFDSIRGVGLPMEPGKPRRFDYEYERRGVAEIFMFTEPLTGLRWVNVRKRRTRKDWVAQVRWLLEEIFSDAAKVTLVCDSLNTTPGLTLRGL
ncbi:MAG: hypothetical protein HS108_06370 [Planctomycetes bacterium]|jgi:hypothetical protein|nr:hypothetical protein [Planctomycetota bacterium]